MATIKSLNKWANSNTYLSIDIVRIALGIFLFIKGISFLGQTETLTALIKPLQGLGWSLMIIHYIAPAHIIGGLLIAVGLLTRWSIIVQLPVLIGAILINFLGEMNSFNLILSLVAFLVCVFFLFYGSGKHSADYYFKMQM